MGQKEKHDCEISWARFIDSTFQHYPYTRKCGSIKAFEYFVTKILMLVASRCYDCNYLIILWNYIIKYSRFWLVSESFLL